MQFVHCACVPNAKKKYSLTRLVTYHCCGCSNDYEWVIIISLYTFCCYFLFYIYTKILVEGGALNEDSYARLPTAQRSCPAECANVSYDTAFLRGAGDLFVLFKLFIIFFKVAFLSMYLVKRNWVIKTDIVLITMTYYSLFIVNI